MSDRLRVVPLELPEANAFVARHHRHSAPVVGHRWSIGAALGDDLHGVAIVGRPVARMRQDGRTLEVLRLCTDGYRNACSFLYGAAWRAARALGWEAMGTYIRKDEDGTSLKAAGWRHVHDVRGAQWSRPDRPRDPSEVIDKELWEAVP